jgi:hypothetical protein
MASPPLQPAEVMVEQTVAGGPMNAKLPAEVYVSPTAVVEEDRMTHLQVECRQGSTWMEHPRRSWNSPLSLLLFLSGTDHNLLPDAGTHELVEGLALEGHQVLMDLCAHPLGEQGCLLRVHVNIV